MGYQGWFSKLDYWQTGLGWDQFNSRSVEAFDRVNLLKGGLYHATIVSTVSPRYAREIQTPEGGEKLDGVLRDRGGDVLGVLNGIDESVWNPETDRLIAEPYSAADLSGKAACKAALQQKMGLPVEARAPLVGLVSRFAHQKGIDVFAGALDRVLAAGAQVVVLGSGDAWAEQLFQELSTRTKLRCFIGMNETLAHEIEAGADLFTMPSRYEPCGLNQMYSQRYGTLPVVRAVGGLDDTVEHERTGFKFRELSADALGDALLRAIYVYRHEPLQFRAMQLRAMQKPLGWSHATRQYEALYRLAIAKRHGRLAASRASIMGR
jgi:starch synthase